MICWCGAVHPAEASRWSVQHFSRNAKCRLQAPIAEHAPNTKSLLPTSTLSRESNLSEHRGPQSGHAARILLLLVRPCLSSMVRSTLLRGHDTGSHRSVDAVIVFCPMKVNPDVQLFLAESAKNASYQLAGAIFGQYDSLCHINLLFHDVRSGSCWLDNSGSRPLFAIRTERCLWMIM